MANPQLEDGHTRIANEILEHLMKLHLAPNQWQVLTCIFRKTYGFHKKVDYIANVQIGAATDLGKVAVSRCLKELEDRQLITRDGKHIGFQKDWEKWEKLSKSATFPDDKSCRNRQQKLAISSIELPKTATKVSSPRVTQKKETITKETIQKKEGPPKKRYGEFNNVLLSDDEYRKLQDKFGAKVPDMIEALSTGIESHGYKYQSHYATILNWKRRDEKQNGGQNGTHRGHSKKLPPRDGYTKPRPNPKLDKLVEQQRAADSGPGRDEPG